MMAPTVFPAPMEGKGHVVTKGACNGGEWANSGANSMKGGLSAWGDERLAFRG